MSVPVTPTPPRTQSATATPQKSARKRLVNASFANYNEDEDPTFIDEATEVSDSEDSISVISTDVSLSDATQDSVLTKGGDGDIKTGAVAQEPETWKEWALRHEIPRKVLHSSIGPFSLYLYTLGCTMNQILYPMIALTTVLFLNDFIRLRNPKVNEMVTKWFGIISRQSEINGWNGTLFYALGVSLVFTSAPKDIAVMSVLLLSWADTAASTIGRLWGKYTPKVMPGKSLAGCLASFATGVFSCYLFYGYFCVEYDYVNLPGQIFWTKETSMMNLHVYALATGVAASVSEASDIGGIDDNLIIPVMSAILLYALVWATKV
ncbi:hypothetical protein FT663_00594 [Candidozyma haemuli var. vulneris]|uniref:Phosphatidate cytidylyltransferase n=1 Tax=Candidozyma haemuli TaxID=45357 RepID=A0A2V1ARF8_9ASCO|nr:hypothetical protein CXQ85_003377 [[Candida] haemuloni]KAF3989028.1 hypothetical protein FT662_03089 [[Candida] haemuloni var. vulneris]KAF3995216.1 hypothetical protein FT663_00594 [[Candida] haemuloni var. vulneris]PVH19531.1 hypothetical protein CXQ85_003377 [[Candida] haemuloni]